MGDEVLSIITRVGLEDLPFLKELNLSLLAQVDQNFEWILVLRPSVSDAELRECLNLSWARKLQVKTIETQTDSRGDLLNVGLNASRGNYLTVVDADDLILDQYVKVFNNASRKKVWSKSILRAQAGKQIISSKKKGKQAIASESRVTFDWPTKFDLLQHLSANQTPCHSVVFPTSEIKKLKLTWDPDLVFTEDWDFLTNALQYLKVVDIDEKIAIYRQERRGSRSLLGTKKTLRARSESIVRLRIMLDRVYIHDDFENHFNSHGNSRVVRLISTSIPKNTLVYSVMKKIYTSIRGLR